MKYSGLYNLLRALTEKRNMHISVHDVSGVLRYDELKLPQKYKIHSKPFCDTAKSTAKGFDLCMRCKARANRLSVENKEPFSGLCPFGLYEYALPVLINGSAVCIIYAGNAVTDKEKSLGKLSKASRLTGVDSKLLKNALAGAEVLCGPESLENAAGVVKDYITLVLSRKKLSLQSGENWRVHEVREYLLANYTRNITLKQLARLYFANEKYLGRLFRRETGLTVKQFINARRLEKTENELIFTEKAVLDIALDAGFSNVTYFNRLFFQKHAMPPSEFRLTHSGK
jgi:AraC-like DNA-binding protein/ligand-binding sensor protein